MDQQNNHKHFEASVLPHLDAAYNLALWLTRRPSDAEDVLQEALIRALKYFGGFRGENSKAWLLVIVRNTCMTWFQKHRNRETDLHLEDNCFDSEDPISNPETEVQRDLNRQAVRKAIADLPIEFREVVVLREIEGLSYKDISEIIQLPVGTVMSRLSRGRARLQDLLHELRSPS